MKARIMLLILVLGVLLVWTPPAKAITFGTLDNGLHPNVGALLFKLEDDSMAMVCSGTLISPTIFLTASHCVAWMPSAGISAEDVFVTFADEIGEGPFYRAASYHVNPNYGHDEANPFDVAVVVLEDPIIDIAPAHLPTAGLLHDLKAEGSLKYQRFVAVGYGTVREDKTHDGQSLFWDPVRRYAEQEPLALEPSWLLISMNPSTGNGGTCYGDSGGPHFLSDTNIVVAVTVTGDRFCRATDKTYRMDTPSAREFLGQFVPLP